MAGKLKRIAPRTSFEGEPPDPRRRRPRLASEPTSRHLRLSDRWEPGFLRLPVRYGAPCLSYVVDGLGIHYDATAPSELEILLEDGGWDSDALLERAERGIADLRRLRLTVDNDPRRRPLSATPGRAGTAGRDGGPVVVVDQPRGDVAIGFGLAGPSRFAAMLRAALAENPGQDVAVIMDPAAPVAHRPGHLDEDGADRVRIVREPVDAWSAVEAARRVYVVSSHVGFEAALAGRPVTCFGVPFYAGWGFTDDRLIPPRRTARRDVREVFAAAYLLYSRYFDPFTGKACTFEEAVETLRLVVERDRDNDRRTVCVGFAGWKRPWLERTLGAGSHVPRMLDKAAIRPEDVREADRVIAWSSRAPEGVEAACRETGVALLRMEDGFLRSVGLGVALRAGASYVLDGTGVYYDATRPSDLELILQDRIFGPDVLERAAALRSAIVEARVSKYNVGDADLPAIPRSGPLILVAGQVEDDASIRLGGTTVVGNAGLLKRARERHPGAVIAYKPHPDVEAGLRQGHIPDSELATLADVVLRNVSAADAIDAADHVEVRTSLIGFEAILRGKPVTTHGLPFYAGWGLTESPPCPRRTRHLSVDELVAGALIAYPRYVDPRTSLPCSPEVLVRRLGENDPALSPRARSREALLKAAWSLLWQAVRR